MSSRTPPSTPRSLKAVQGLLLIENVSPGSGIGNLCTARLMFESTEHRDAFTGLLEKEESSISETTGHAISITSSEGESSCNITLEGSHDYMLLVTSLSARFDIGDFLVEGDVEEERILVDGTDGRGCVIVKTHKQCDGKFEMSINGYIDGEPMLAMEQVFRGTQNQMENLKGQKREYFKKSVQSRLESDQEQREEVLRGFSGSVFFEESKRIEQLSEDQRGHLVELGLNVSSVLESKLLIIMNSGHGVAFENAVSRLFEEGIDTIEHDNSGGFSPTT